MCVGVMNYGRKAVGNALRKAGDAVRNFDDAYSKKIHDMYDGISMRAHNEGRQPSTAEGLTEALGLVLGGSQPSFRRADVTPTDPDAGPMKQAAAKALSYAVPVANAVPKYVLPATGVTLAGKGLIDIAGAIGQQTSGTLEP